MVLLNLNLRVVNLRVFAIVLRVFSNNPAHAGVIALARWSTCDMHSVCVHNINTEITILS